MTDLDAIRARRARANAIAHVLGRTPCDDDADALLAEVDRLTARWESASVGYIRDTERARIAAEVRGLPEASADGMWEWFGHNAPPTIVDRAAVLAAIEGVPPTIIADLPDIGTGYPEPSDA